MIALIDYGSGNIRSVSKALAREGADVRLVSEPSELKTAEAVVLPGVGDFGDCARNIKARGLWDPIQEWLRADKPFLGICVGYQLLFDSSEEAPGERGFGFFSGPVQRFRTPGLKVPQIGWNNLEFPGTRHPLWNGLPNDPFVFFVHSYYPSPEDQTVITACTTYGQTFAASAARGRVAGMQFHPEKSQEAGLTILRNFVKSIA
ncbi:MAG: imidazole glycerol-phosphate synthase subunit HisH [Chthoniobacter sp.]|nr:imidazole glycerol-phosphate synthase subunit HisH [Chthoniobacter sp.]